MTPAPANANRIAKSWIALQNFDRRDLKPEILHDVKTTDIDVTLCHPHLPPFALAEEMHNLSLDPADLETRRLTVSD